MWFFLAIIQGQGGVGAAYGTQLECEAEQTRIAAQSDTISISPCVQVALSQPGAK